MNLNFLDGFDRYSRGARLYPALLLTLPFLVTTICLFNNDLFSGKLPLSFSMFAYFGGLYLTSNICRSLGKELEKKYISSWGGMPTTIILRHQDRTLNNQEKKRYHNFLNQNVPGMEGKFPTKLDEQNRPYFADDMYDSSISWLREQRRDKEKYNLVYEELIQYGFRRNLASVKPYGIAVCIMSLAFIITSFIFDSGSISTNINEIPALIEQNITTYHIASLLLTLTALCCWITIIGEQWVKDAAYDYAVRLVRSIDKN